MQVDVRKSSPAFPTSRVLDEAEDNFPKSRGLVKKADSARDPGKKKAVSFSQPEKRGAKKGALPLISHCHQPSACRSVTR